MSHVPQQTKTEPASIWPALLIGIGMVSAMASVWIVAMSHGTRTGYNEGYRHGKASSGVTAECNCVPPDKRVRILMTSVPIGVECKGTLEVLDLPPADTQLGRCRASLESATVAIQQAVKREESYGASMAYAATLIKRSGVALDSLREGLRSCHEREDKAKVKANQAEAP